MNILLFFQGGITDQLADNLVKLTPGTPLVYGVILLLLLAGMGLFLKLFLNQLGLNQKLREESLETIKLVTTIKLQLGEEKELLKKVTELIALIKHTNSIEESDYIKEIKQSLEQIEQKILLKKLSDDV